MTSEQTRHEIEEALKCLSVSQVASQMKVSRNTVIKVKQGWNGNEWERRRREIAESAKAVPVKALAEKYGVSKSRIYAVLKKERGE